MVGLVADSVSQSVDLPMSRVKFNVNTEYAYLQNFKILQSKANILELRTP